MSKQDESSESSVQEIQKVPADNIISTATETPSQQTSTTKQELPEAPNTAESVRKRLKEKVVAGQNLSDKNVYPRIFKEIAEIENCSYQNVAKIAKQFLKKSSGSVDDKTISDGSIVTVKTVKPEERPPRKEKPASEASATLSRIIPVTMSKEQIDTMLQFESDMIELSFDNIAMFLKSVGMPAPQQKKIKQMCHTIALFNQKMEMAGKPDQKIDVGEKLLPWMIKIGCVGLFLQPIAGKYFSGKDSKSEIKKEPKSMRS